MKKIITGLLVLIISIFLVGCLAEEKEEKELKLTFKLNGVSKEYSTTADYGFGNTNGYNGCSWLGDEGHVNITLPLNPTAGTTYTVGTGDYDIDFDITETLGATITTDNGFAITVTEWNNVDGGVIKGTFSGTVHVDLELQTVTEGAFEARYTPDIYE